MLHLRFTFAAAAIALALFVGMLLFIEIGRRLGARQTKTRDGETKTGSTVGDSVVYALLALLIGFTFNGAAARFDNRRHLVVEEVSTASTAWERIESLAPEQQEPVRADFRRFIDAVIAPPLDDTPNKTEALIGPASIARAQKELWTRATAACLTPAGEKARMLLLPSLSEMFGAVEKERLARRIHPPAAIWVMLAVAALAGSLFVGYGMASIQTRNWLYIFGVAATISAATFVILEMEYPRLGLIQVDAMDQALVELRATLN
jgi:hypothetical protein